MLQELGIQLIAESTRRLGPEAITAWESAQNLPIEDNFLEALPGFAKGAAAGLLVSLLWQTARNRRSHERFNRFEAVAMMGVVGMIGLVVELLNVTRV